MTTVLYTSELVHRLVHLRLLSLHRLLLTVVSCDWPLGSDYYRRLVTSRTHGKELIRTATSYTNEKLIETFRKTHRRLLDYTIKQHGKQQCIHLNNSITTTHQQAHILTTIWFPLRTNATNGNKKRLQRRGSTARTEDRLQIPKSANNSTKNHSTKNQRGQPRRPTSEVGVTTVLTTAFWQYYPPPPLVWLPLRGSQEFLRSAGLASVKLPNCASYHPIIKGTAAP